MMSLTCVSTEQKLEGMINLEEVKRSEKELLNEFLHEFKGMEFEDDLNDIAESTWSEEDLLEEFLHEFGEY